MACNTCSGASSDCGCSCSITELPTGNDGASAYVYVASANDASGTGYTYPANPAQCWLAIKSSTTALTPVVANFAGLWFNKCGNGLVENTVFVDSVYGVDATGLAERADYPFKTIAAARTAAIALTPSSTKRIKIVLQEAVWLNETITLYNYIDWDLGCSTIKRTTIGSNITDGGVACNSIIYGAANIIQSSTGAGNAYGIFIDDPESNVQMYCNDISVTSEGATLNRAVRCEGKLQLYCNNISSYGTTGNTCAVIATNGGTLNIICNDIYSTSTGPLNCVISDNTGGVAKLYLRANNLTSEAGNNSSGMYTVSISGEGYVTCNDIYHKTAGSSVLSAAAVIAANSGTPKGHVKCNNIFVTPDTCAVAVAVKLGNQPSGTATTSGAYLFVECQEARVTGVLASTTNYAILTELCTANAPILRVKGRYVVDSASNVICARVVTGTLIVQDAVLVAAGTGASISNAGVAKNYGGVVGNTNSTGTILVNGSIIGDTDVV